MGLFDFFLHISPVAALLFVFGLILVVFEMFHPGFGAPGITGTIFLFVGVILTAKTFAQAVVMILIILALLVIAMLVAYRSLTKGRLSRTIVLKDKEAGFAATENMQEMLQKRGVTLTALRPAGTAVFDGARLDVVTQGEFIPKGSTVDVIKISGRRIVVAIVPSKNEVASQKI